MNADPFDLAILACAIARHAGPGFSCSLEDAEQMQTIAEMLHTEWLQIDANEWGAVFGYEVTEPLGIALGQCIQSGESLDMLQDFAQAKARELIREAMQ